MTRDREDPRWTGFGLGTPQLISSTLLLLISHRQPNNTQPSTTLSPSHSTSLYTSLTPTTPTFFLFRWTRTGTRASARAQSRLVSLASLPWLRGTRSSSRRTLVSRKVEFVCPPPAGTWSHRLTGPACPPSANTQPSLAGPHELRPSDVLIERFQAYKRLTSNLIAYFEGIADIEVGAGWSSQLRDRSIADPLVSLLPLRPTPPRS